MGKGNVLVIGNSGVGKSTLINAVLGEEKAETGWGSKGTTDKLTISENKELLFKIIDTVGFVPSRIGKNKAIKAVQNWSEKSAKEGNSDTQISAIWICVEGTSRKLFPEIIKTISKATKIWESVPVIVVITKSYSEPDRKNNIEMINTVFAKQKRYSKNLRKVIPVVASQFILNYSACAAPEGISELIEATNDLMPEGIKSAKEDIAKFTLKRKRAFSHGLVGMSTSAAVLIGAVSIPYSDAIILLPIETAEVNGIARIYGIRKNEESKLFFNSIIQAGTIGVAAKTGLNALKTIPGVNLETSALNGIVAGSSVAALGEVTIYAFEQVYLGKKSISDVDWVQNAVAIGEDVTRSLKARNVNKIKQMYEGIKRIAFMEEDDNLL
jgi:GTPase SAR1 family protein/uncharacterized protein (DUF697 family)